MEVRELGRVAYNQALLLQEDLVARIVAGQAEETLLLLEHPPVYTLGRGGHLENVLDEAIEVVHINRGGDITYHAPGQLVGYPLLNLGRRGRDLHHYLRFLEEVLIQTTAHYGVAAWREAGLTGVWTAQGKLASIGAGARRWVSMHGFALNVSVDLAGFQRIHPCGLPDCCMVSLEGLTERQIPMPEVKGVVAEIFQRLLPAWLPEAVHSPASGCGQLRQRCGSHR